MHKLPIVARPLQSLESLHGMIAEGVRFKSRWILVGATAARESTF